MAIGNQKPGFLAIKNRRLAALEPVDKPDVPMVRLRPVYGGIGLAYRNRLGDLTFLWELPGVCIKKEPGARRVPSSESLATCVGFR